MSYQKGILTLAMCFCLTQTGWTQVTFQSQDVFLAGDAANDVAAGDFDRDGDIDLAVANRDDDTVVILLNNGLGVFTRQDPINIIGHNESRPYALAAGDLDRDGVLDLAAAVLGTDQVAVLHGNGDATFGEPVLYQVGDAPGYIAVGDFDNTYGPDLITVNTSGNSTSVLLNNGDGTFGSPIDNTVGHKPRAVAVADFNNDGTVDIATAQGQDQQREVAVQLGNGEGTFMPATIFQVGRDPWAILAADLNKDGRLDLAVANGTDTSVSILLGDGTGNFTVLGPFATDVGPRDIAAADFDGDGNLDLATANFEADNVSVLLGAGTGAFGSPQNFRVGSGPAGIVAANLTSASTKLGIATANQEGDTVSVLLPGAAVMPPVELDVCGQSCGPLGFTPMLLTLLGLVGMRRYAQRLGLR